MLVQLAENKLLPVLFVIQVPTSERKRNSAALYKKGRTLLSQNIVNFSIIPGITPFDLQGVKPLAANNA